MLAAPLRGDVGDGAFEHLEQSLLDAFAADVAGNRDVTAGLGPILSISSSRMIPRWAASRS